MFVFLVLLVETSVQFIVLFLIPCKFYRLMIFLLSYMHNLFHHNTITLCVFPLSFFFKIPQYINLLLYVNWADFFYLIILIILTIYRDNCVCHNCLVDSFKFSRRSSSNLKYSDGCCCNKDSSKSRRSLMFSHPVPRHRY